MKQGVWGLVIGVTLAMGGAAAAQDAWVQIEAQPTLREGEDRARDWAETFPNVAGFALSSGWYAIALGPFTPEQAAAQAQLLRSEGMIPSDSYVADSAKFRQKFWPVGPAANIAAAPAAPAAPLPEAAAPGTAVPEAAAPQVAPAPQPDPVETLAQARAAEAALSRAEREEIQSALNWTGHYTAAIDGAFGPGTRRSMAEWQSAVGEDPTGVLTTAQRARLLAEVAADRTALGLETVTEAEAGIEIQLPTGLVVFDHYDPPFVHYAEKDGSGVKVLLISRQGDQAALFALYDAMQGLEIVPIEGARERSRTGFTLTGQNARLQSYTQAELKGGLIKGFTLVYPASEAARMERVLAAMKASFRPLGNTALNDALGEPLAVPKAGLMAGLDLRRPMLSRSGFYIDAQGGVLTTADVVAGCGRITIDGTEAEVTFADAALGLAVLRPKTLLAPRIVAEFQTALPRPDAEVAVAGYPYEDAISAPVLTFGTLSREGGLAAEPGHVRLALAALPGDAGGPVLDAAGAVVGMLLPKDGTGGRVLPADLAVALQSGALATVLAERGLAPQPATRSGAMAAEDLARLATGMTVLVSCWE